MTWRPRTRQPGTDADGVAAAGDEMTATTERVADGQRDAYRPLDHTPADDPQTPLDDRELRHRIRYGHP